MDEMENKLSDNDEEPELLTHDKSTWGPGPWQDEPDRVEWQHAGLPCLITRNHFGNLCGYAAVPPGHALHGKRAEDADVRAHGGVNYVGACSGQICHIAKPGEPADVWWFGFDCGHAFDYLPAMAARGRSLDNIDHSLVLHLWPPYDHEAAMSAHQDDESFSFVERYRTLDYVQAEVNQLAEQLAALA